MENSLLGRILFLGPVLIAIFFNPSASNSWPFMMLKALPRRLSDHSPLLVSTDLEFGWGPRPFRSINAWWSHEHFKSFLKQSWSSIQEHSFVISLVFFVVN